MADRQEELTVPDDPIVLAKAQKHVIDSMASAIKQLDEFPFDDRTSDNLWAHGKTLLETCLARREGDPSVQLVAVGIWDYLTYMTGKRKSDSP